ncbi:MAG: Hpt domain-containing protein [Myxococcota bacterium]|nr:Hpt domain-containing protein [Myxococcota bacterium]
MSGDAEIDAIHAEFRAGLPARIARMRGLADEARSGARSGAVDDLRTAAHRLRGACGSFGMTELEEPSRIIEHACKAGPGWAAVDAALDTLAKLIAR